MIEITVNLDALEKQLARLADLGRDMSPVTMQLAGILADASERAFAEERDPVSGEAWHPLSPVTIGQRAKTGHEDSPILQVRGLLAASIQTAYGPDFAVAGTNEPHARTHQFGALRGAHGRTGRGGPIPWGTVVPRPFLGIGPDDEEEIMGVLRDNVRKALGGD